jgi:ABC-type transporter Mla subunit MlaD
MVAAAVAALVVVAAVRARRGREVLVVFPSASGLREGAPVTYLGADVGTVGHVERSAGQAVVRLRIRRRDVVLRKGDEPRLRTMGLLGDAAIDIRPGPLEAARLERGDTLHGGGAAASPEPARMLEALMRGGPRPRRDSVAAAASAPLP